MVTTSILLTGCSGSTGSPTAVDVDSPDADPVDSAASDAATDEGDVDSSADSPADAAINDTRTPDIDAAVVEPDAPEDARTDPESDAADGDEGPGGPWRSELYPIDWTPGHATDDGRFLHDFSYAGYRRGADLPDSVVFGQVIPVDVDATGQTDATEAIQAALDAAADAGGGVVLLPTGTLRVDGQLVMHGDRVVLRGAGRSATRLWFTDTTLPTGGSHLRVGPFATVDGRYVLPSLLGERVPITASGATWDNSVEVASVDPFAVGDLVAVGWTITPEFVAEYGMTGTWVVFIDQPVVFFRREVVAVDTDARRVQLDIPLRTPFSLRDAPTLARVAHASRDIGLEGFSIATATDEATAWAHDRQAAIELIGVVDGWVRDLESFAPPGVEPDPDDVLPHLRSGGLRVAESSRITITDTHLAHTQNRGGGGNGYLFEVLQSGEVLTVDSTARRGRHGFIQNWGFGTTGCVWLRVHTTGGAAATGGPGSFETPGLSEFHHSLATANLIDSARIDDGWGAVNRLAWSSGAGHTAHQNVMWAATGAGVVNWFNFGDGYVIGTGPDINVFTDLPWFGGDGTEPADHTEGRGIGATLVPGSLYEDQLTRRRTRERIEALPEEP